MTSRRLQLRIWLLALDRFELKLRGKIAQQRNRYIRVAASQYEKHGSIAGWLIADHKQKINDILTEHYSAVIPHFGAMVLKQVKSKRVSLEQKRMTLHTSFMLEWLKTEALRKAAMISETDRTDIQNAIESGVIDGVGAAEIAARIRDVSGFTPFRSATVARTETHNAATFGSIETARQAEQDVGIVLLKEWLPTMDNRTRDAHRAMAGKDPIPLNEKFEVDGEMMDRPSDQSASAENVINCRCGMIFEEKQ